MNSPASTPTPRPASPTVTVVIPCYNYERYLAAAIDSALHQSGVIVNIVIVDDASSDGSVEVAQHYADSDSRVSVIRHSQNHGHVETFNEGLRLASGEFIVKLDADDLLTPGSLARSAALLTEHTDVVFCYGHAERFHGEAPTEYVSHVRGWRIWPGQQWLASVFRCARNPIQQPEIMVRRQAVIDTGGYRPELRWAEDYNWWMRLAATGSVGRVEGPTQGLYRYHEESLQRSDRNYHLTDARARISAIDLFFKECGELVRDADELERVALSGLARETRRSTAYARERGELDTADELARIADDLDERTHVDTSTVLLGRASVLGRVARNLDERWKWKLLARYGIREFPAGSQLLPVGSQ